MLQLVRISFLVIIYVIIVVLYLTTKGLHPQCQIQVQCCLLVLVHSFNYPAPTFYPPTPFLYLPVHSLPLPPPFPYHIFVESSYPLLTFLSPSVLMPPVFLAPLLLSLPGCFLLDPPLSSFFYFTDIIPIKMYFWAKLK